MKGVSILVYHDSYGCESGCCGHRIEVTGVPRELIAPGYVNRFDFGHPRSNWPEELTDEQRKAYAIEYATEYLEKYAPKCLALINWDLVLLDYEKVSAD